ncbi:MAG: WD40 repeat domain-containing protein [Deltaproteobacteria bacterium]|nr:WD40 repeat domain-containing protein [Deltaproteobacteria bacterium]
MRISFVVVAAGVFLIVGSACPSVQVVDEDAVLKLKTAPAGSYLQGTPLGLGEPVVVNRRDFVYALAFDPRSRELAFVHHVSTHMELTTTGIEPLAPRFQEKVNPSEFDCEDVAFAGDRVLVVSRQGTLRAFERASGRLINEVATGEGLVRVAVNADASVVAVGSTEGRVLLFEGKGLALIGEGQPHVDEVRGLAFLRDGRLVSVSQDGTLKVSVSKPAEAALVRVPTTGLPKGDRVFLTHVDGWRAVSTVRDSRQTSSIISRAAVKRLELAAPKDARVLSVLTAEGSKEVPAVDVGALRLRTLELGSVTAAVCDDCLPTGVELMLGQDVLSHINLVEDVARDEMVARPLEGDATAKLVEGARVVVEAKAVTLPGPATDLDVSATGAVLASFSTLKAERSYDLHDAEKRGNFPPPSPTSGAAFVDVDAGTLGKLFVNGHLGFTVTGGVSPDGRTVVTGGWDRRLLVWDAVSGEVVTERSLGWLVRRARFTPDGHLVGAAAWTPVNALNEGDSEPSLLLYPMALAGASIAQAP